MPAPKHYLTLLCLLFSYVLYGARYYVSNQGNDNSNGLSEATAWRTIAKVNSTTFAPGDYILFQRGGVWRETLVLPSSGTLASYIRFLPYGNGDLPRIYGSNTSKWVKYSDNVWISGSTFKNPYGGDYKGGVFFEDQSGKVTWGLSNVLSGMLSPENLTKEYQWTWVNGYIYIFSSGDPNSAYRSVEVSQRDNCIYLNDKNNILLDGLDIRYSRLAGIKEKWPFKGITTGLEIRNCHVSHIGVKGSTVGYGIEIWHSNTWVHHNEIHECGRRGLNARTQDADYSVSRLGVRSPVVLQNVLFERNTIYNCYHSLVSFVSEEVNGLLKDCTIRYNYCYEDRGQNLVAPEGYYCGHYGFGGHYGGGYNTFKNVNVYCNISVGSTAYAFDASGVDHISYFNNVVYGLNPNSGDTNVGCFWIQGQSHDCMIMNNIFYNDYSSKTSTLRACVTIQPDCYLGMKIDYNTYFNTDPYQACFIALGGKGGGYLMSEFSKYKAATGFDKNSLVADPLFVSDSDLRLQTGSPSIGKGAFVGIQTDYSGNYYNNPPTMGIYEMNPSDNPPSDNSVSFIMAPNPAKDVVYMLLGDDTSAGTFDLAIYSYSGSKVYSNTIELSRNAVPVYLDLCSGVYVVQLLAGGSTLASKKLVISR